MKTVIRPPSTPTLKTVTITHAVKQPLSFDEFAWRCLWLEIGRLSRYVAPYYTHQSTRKLIRRAKLNVLWNGPYGDRSEWGRTVRTWYAAYLVQDQTKNLTDAIDIIQSAHLEAINAGTGQEALNHLYNAYANLNAQRQAIIRSGPKQQ